MPLGIKDPFAKVPTARDVQRAERARMQEEHNDYPKTNNNSNKSYDPNATVGILFTWSRTVVPKTLMRYDFWFYIVIYTTFEVLENYVELPELNDRFALMSYPMVLLTFTTVFFLNNSWTRYLKLYDCWQSMHIEAVELTMLVVTKCKDFDRARTIVNYTMGSLYLNLYLHQGESGDEKLKETGMIPPKHFEKLQAAIDDGYSGSDMLDMWSLRALQDSSIKGPELNFVQARVLSMSKHGHTMKALMDLPVPHEYYHLLNIMIFCAFVLLAYVLAMAKNFATGILYVALLIAILGMRELAVIMAMPFGNDYADFHIERAIGETKNDIDFILSEDGDPDSDTARTGSAAQDRNPVSEASDDNVYESLLQ